MTKRKVLDVDKVFRFQPFEYNESILEAERYCGSCPDSETWAIRIGHLLEERATAYKNRELNKN